MRTFWRRWYVWLAIVLAGLLGASLLCRSGGTRITEANFQRIENGMTVAEVEAILGRPPDSKGGPPGFIFSDLHSSDLQEENWFWAERVREDGWDAEPTVEGNLIVVGFDRNGIVVTKWFGQFSETTAIQRARDWLRWWWLS